MKKFLPIVFFLCACSGSPEKKASVVKADQSRLDSVLDRAAQFRKAKDEMQADVPYDSVLTNGENLQDYFRFVIKDRYIVLKLNVDTSVASGAPQLAGKDYPAAVTKTLKSESITDSLKAFIGKKFHMVDEGGNPFDASIAKLKFMLAYYAFDGVPQDSAISSAELARQVWQDGIYSQGMIVGEIDTVFTEQAGIIAAIPYENKPPVFYPSSENTHLEAQAKEDIRLTEQFSVIQKNFLRGDSTAKEKNSWLDDASGPFIYCSADAKTAFYAQTLTAGDYCGGPFYGELTSAWEMRDGQKGHLLFCLPFFCFTEAILDLEGDGTPEFFASDESGCPMLFKKVNGRWTRVAYMPLMDMRCPC
jgi:hypothetical protein